MSEQRLSWIKFLGRAWPQSLFGRLVAACTIAVLLAQVGALALIAHERERFVLEVSVRDWSRRIAEIALTLQPMNASERAETTSRLIEQYARFGRRALLGEARRRLQTAALADELPGAAPRSGPRSDDGPGAAPGGGWPRLGPTGTTDTPVPVGPRDSPDLSTASSGGGPGEVPPPPGGPVKRLRSPIPRVSLPPRQRVQETLLPLPLAGDFEHPLVQTLQNILGSGYRISVAAASPGVTSAIQVSPLQALERRGEMGGLYDVTVQYPDGGSTLFRIARPAEGAPIPRNLLVNLSLLVVIMGIALFVTARSITQPLFQLANAADRVGRDVRQPKLEEKGAREIRDAARAFNTMQDRLQRYLDSRTRVLAAMSHDLKTPLTRLRLQVETLEDDPDAQARIGKQLDEMESMVRGALALFRGLDDDEALAPVDIDALLGTLQAEFTQMGGKVSVQGSAQSELFGKPQGLKRCLTNLIENAIKFGGGARIYLQDAGAAVVIRIDDDGPGIPAEELERVFEPFYRVESSRNRDSGGTGLGLSIARDIAQSHGGSLVLRNLPQRGLEAVLTLPRQPR
ncbi:MAG TPA: ATP-binding protein [Steroidobacteraceae bacterium]|nr:ATP-binding protein [Steroidobacteraceae bacterium]